MGVENRTCALRVIPGSAKSQRVEYRVAAADANPYVILAAALGSGLWGIENRIEPEPLVEGNAYDHKFPGALALPRTLWEAAQRLKQSQHGARLVRRRVRAITSPRRASGKSASSASTSPTGNWRGTSRSSDA